LHEKEKPGLSAASESRRQNKIKTTSLYLLRTVHRFGRNKNLLRDAKNARRQTKTQYHKSNSAAN